MVLPDLYCCSAGQSGRDTLHHMQLKQLEDNPAGWPPCRDGVLAQCCWLELQPTEQMCCSSLVADGGHSLLVLGCCDVTGTSSSLSQEPCAVLEALIQAHSADCCPARVQHTGRSACSTKSVQMLHCPTFHPQPSSVVIRFRKHAANQPREHGSTVHSHPQW